MSFNIPNTFVAGTKAKADEVNENFSAVQNELNKNAQDMAEIKKDMDYFKNELVDDFVSEAQMASLSKKSRFSINSAHLAPDGKTPDIFDTSSAGILAFKVGGEYPVLIATNAYGESETFESIEAHPITGYESGYYNVFLTIEGNIELYKTTFTRSPKMPENPALNDIWLMTLEPWCCYKYNGVSWAEYDGILLGRIRNLVGTISEVENTCFNTEFLDADCLFLTQRARANISRRFESSWMSVDSKGLYSFEHNLNISPEHYSVRLLARVKTNIGNYKTGDILDTTYSNFIGNIANSELGCIFKCENNKVTIGIGNSEYHCYNDLGSNGYYGLKRDNLQYKIIVTEDVN